MTFCVTTAALQCGTEVCRNRVFFFVTIGLAVLCRNRARLAGRCRDKARSTRVIGQCCLVARCTVLCNCLNYSALALFMGTVKKKYKNDPQKLGRHIYHTLTPMS